MKLKYEVARYCHNYKFLEAIPFEQHEEFIITLSL